MSDKPVKLICPNLSCRTILSVPGRARGKEVRCRACGTTVGVPEQASPRPDAETADAATPNSDA